MSKYMGIIFAVIGLFSTTVLFSICMSCYKCFMKRRKKTLAKQHLLEMDKITPATETAVPQKSGGGKGKSPSNPQKSKSYGQGGKSGHSNGHKYPKVTGPTIATLHDNQPSTSGMQNSPQNSPQNRQSPDTGLKRHSMYYSVESMSSLNSAIEGPIDGV